MKELIIVDDITRVAYAFTRWMSLQSPTMILATAVINNMWNMNLEAVVLFFVLPNTAF